MIEINNNKERNIVFEVQLSGINSTDLNGYFRIYVDGIEYGFPAEISETAIGVDLPALKTIIHRPLRSGEKFKAKLELVGNDNYLVPWDDNIVIKSSVMVEAKIIDNETKSKKPIVKVLNKSEEPIKESKEIKKPIEKKKDIKVTKEHLIQYMIKHGTKNENIQEIIMNRCIEKVGDTDNKKIFAELYNYYKKND